MAKILVIDDEFKILRLISNSLKINGHEVTAYDNPANVPASSLKAFDLILLDVMMPETDGFTYCRQIREEITCPIVFLTAKTEEEAVVQGLMSGGDDYIKKPFSVMELNARVDAHLRRENRKEAIRRLVLDKVTIYLDEHRLEIDGKPVQLTRTQYDICKYLASGRGRVYSKEQIYDAVYNLESDTMISTVTEYIRVIRNKFKELGINPIETIWGVGYRWK